MTRAVLLLLLGACASPAVPDAAPADPAPPDDTGTTDTGTVDTAPVDTDLPAPDTGADTATPPPGCPDAGPGADLSLHALLDRLDAQHCLSDADQLALSVHMADFATHGIQCDTVLRTSSPDGRSGWSEPELVRPGASVPDVLITREGVHIVVFNDVTAGRLVQLVHDDPERLFRQGLLGLGGLGWIEDTGAGFVERDDVDLLLPSLRQVVDPDLGVDALGRAHLTWFSITPAELPDGTWDPLSIEGLHHFYRNSSTDLHNWTSPSQLLAFDSAKAPTSDPTLLDLDDGGQILFLSHPGVATFGFVSPDGDQWARDADPDLTLPGFAVTPDALPDPAGGYRMYARAANGAFSLSTSPDGRAWSAPEEVLTPWNASGLSAAVDPDGTWWLYYAIRDPACIDALEGHDG